MSIKTSYAPYELRDVKNINQLQKILQQIGTEHHEKLLYVIDFYATWCGPCMSLKPKIYDSKTSNGLARKYAKQVVFIYVDLDQHGDLADEMHVSSIPHLFLFSGTKQRFVDECKGGDVRIVEDMIKRNL